MVKENGKRFKTRKHATNMKENTKTTRKMVKVSSNGKVGMFTKEITKMMRGMDMEKCIG